MTIESSVQRITRLTPLDTILTRVQTRIAAVAPRRAPISQSLGAVLAEDVRAAECPPRLWLARAAAAKTPILDAAQATLSRCAAMAGCMVRQTESLAEALKESQCDVVIGIGGTGSGRCDGAVQEVARLGTIEAYGMAMAPGETAALGFVGERPVLLVPGR